MIKLILINVLLFLLCIILWVCMAAGIGYAMRNRPSDDIEVAMAYIAVAGLHLFVNHRLLKKWQMDTLRRKITSAILIILAYIFYPSIYYLIYYKHGR